MIKKLLKFTTSYLLIYLFIFSFPFAVEPPKFGVAYAVGRGSSPSVCNASPGHTYYKDLGCIKKAEFTAVDKAFRDCLVAGNNSKVNECIMEIKNKLNADKQMVQSEFLPEDDEKMVMNSLVFAAPGILPLFWYARQATAEHKTKLTGGTALSIHAMMGAALITTLTELNQNKKYIDKVQSRAAEANLIGLTLKPGYDSGKDENGNTDLTKYEPIDENKRDQVEEMQRKANQYMIDTEKDMQEFFKKKSNAHRNAAVLYSAAAAYATIEALQKTGNGFFQPAKGGGCDEPRALEEQRAIEERAAARADRAAKKRVQRAAEKKLLEDNGGDLTGWDDHGEALELGSGPTNTTWDFNNNNNNNNNIVVPPSPPAGNFMLRPSEKELFDLTTEVMQKVISIAFPSAYAQKEAQNSGYGLNKGVMAGMAGLLVLGKMVKKIPGGPACMMEVPITRIIIASAGASMSWMFHAKYKKEYENSKDRQVTFEMYAGANPSGCSRDDRDRNASGNEGCFCYTEEGYWNVSRMNNNICKDLFAKKKALISSNYNMEQQNDRVGCVDGNNRWDPQCKCKKGNSCMKLKKLTGFPGLTNTAWYNQLGAGANAALSDSFASGNTNFQAASNKAIKAAKAAIDQAYKKASPKEKADGKAWKKLNDSAIARAKNILQRQFGPNGPSSPASNSIAASKSIKSSSDPKDILKSAREQLNITKHSFGGGAKSTPDSGGSDDWDFNSGGTTNGGLSQGKFDQSEVAAAMNEQYSLNEINENSHQNLFEVITHRYHQSGLKNLFKEEEDEN